MFPMPHSHISRDSDPTLGSLSHPAASSGRRSQPLPQVQSINLTWNITDSKWTFCGGWQRIYSTFYTSLGVATWMGIPKRCPLCSHSLWSVCGSWCSSSPAPLSSASASCWRSMTTCTPASLGTSWAPATRTGRSSGELGVPVPAGHRSLGIFEVVGWVCFMELEIVEHNIYQDNVSLNQGEKRIWMISQNKDDLVWSTIIACRCPFWTGECPF